MNDAVESRENNEFEHVRKFIWHNNIATLSAKERENITADIVHVNFSLGFVVNIKVNRLCDPMFVTKSILPNLHHSITVDDHVP